jgi:hypothetical protein
MRHMSGSDDRSVLAAEAEPRWRTGGTARSGQQSFFGFNAALRQAGDRAVYPIRVEVWLQLQGPSPSGLVDRADLSAVTAVEQTLRDLATGRAVVAAQVTMTGVRSYLLYTGDASLPQELDQALRQRVTDHAVRVQAMADPQWSGYARVLKMGRRSTIGMAILAVFPVMPAAIVGAHLGAGWGIGQVVALYAWIAPLVIVAFRGRNKRRAWHEGRRRMVWLEHHVAWSYAFVSLAMASLLLLFPAILPGHVLSPWACLAIAVAGGVGITTAIWPRQLRYYAELRAGAADSVS